MNTEIIDSDDIGASIRLSKPVRLFLNKFIYEDSHSAVNSYLKNKYNWKTPLLVNDRINSDSVNKVNHIAKARKD